MRLDKYLLQLNIATRSRASLVIKKGYVSVNGVVITKAGYEVKETDIVKVQDLDYASQGGYKLATAIDNFHIDCTNRTCLDIGASNGGFTDYLLKNGAAKVYAIDVGECAFSDELKNDDRVIIKDRLNARYLTYDDIGEFADLVVIDVSYISLRLIIPPLKALIKDNADIIALIKPQFEVGKNNLDKRGVVKDKIIYNTVIEGLKNYLEAEKFIVHKVCEYIPFEKNKNIEFLAHITV